MKRCATILLALLLTAAINGAIIKWDGEAGDGHWNSNSNWSGDQVPAFNDDVILDNEFVAESYVVTLPIGNAAIQVNTLQLVPSEEFYITLTLPTANTSVFGLIATGVDDAIIIGSRGTIINASGASAGTPLAVTTNGYLRINNGGRYIHRTERGHTINLANRLSKAPGTEQGIFEFDVPATSFIVSFAGRTYGTMVFSSITRNGPVSYNGNGVATLRVRGDLIIKDRCTVSNGMSGDLIVEGDLKIGDSACFNVQNTSPNNRIRLLKNVMIEGILMKTGTGIPNLILSGSDTQYLSLRKRIDQNIHINLENEKGVKLGTPFVTRSHLYFVKGKMYSTNDAPLILTDTAQCKGGSESSFVEGPVWCVGNRDSCLFPVRVGSIYMPVKIFQLANGLLDTCKITYHRNNPQSAYGTNYAGNIDHISLVEYWTIAGINDARLSLSVSRTSFVTSMLNTWPVRFEKQSGQWARTLVDERQIYSSPPYQIGWIKTGKVQGDGIYSLGTDQSFTDNPLPVVLINFTGHILEGNIELAARLGTFCDSLYNIVVETSEEGIIFKPIESTIERQHCSVQAQVRKDERKYFRLLIQLENGKKYTSQAIKLIEPIENCLNVYPTITRDKISLEFISGIKQQVVLNIISFNGVLMNQQSKNVDRGRNKIILQAVALPAGWYILNLAGKDQVIGTRKFKVIK